MHAHSPRTFFLLLLFPFLLGSFSLQAYQTGYIIAPSGLNIRSEASTCGAIIGKLPYGHQVRIVDYTGVQLTIKDAGKEITGEWVQIQFERWNDSLRTEKVEGYAFGPFISRQFEGIPPNSILDFYHLYKYTKGDHVEIDWQLGLQSRSRVGPYDPRPTGTMQIYPPDHPMTHESVWDSIKAYLNVRLISNQQAQRLYQQRVKDYPYHIDTTSQGVVISGGTYPSRFFLPIKGGKDSLHFKDQLGGEIEVNTYFVGRIHSLHAYVVSSVGEEPYHTLCDMQTGKMIGISMGYPHISPDGKCVVDIYGTMLSRSTAFTLKGLSSDFSSTGVFNIEFRSWLPDEGYEQRTFWTSNRTLCIPVRPVEGRSKEEWIVVEIQ